MTDSHDEDRRRIAEFGSFGEGSVIFQYLVCTNASRIHIGRSCRIDDFVKLEGGLEMRIGDYVHIASFCHIGIGGGITILERGSGFASGAKIISGSNLPLAESISAAAPKQEQLIKRYRTHIKQNAFICTNAVVLPGITIGEHAVLGAGSVATRDIPDWEIWAGVPAKRIGDCRELNPVPGMEVPR